MKKSVMIVDDDNAILETVSLLLSYYDYQVVKATGGKACLEALRQGFRGVILMDIMMPDLDGWETIRAMVAEQLTRDNLICMLTAKTEPGIEAEGLQELIFDYLPKPFNGEGLLQFVDNASQFLTAAA